MRPTLFLVLLLAACSAPPPPSEQSAPEPPLHVYLLAGQSNMAGRGVVDQIDSTPAPRVFALSSNMTWGPAKEPLHFDKPDVVGVGPGFSFGREMGVAKTGVYIGLVPAAAGGSSIRAWRHRAMHPGTQSPPWDDALTRTFRVLAMEGGELKGILWHQGESDSKDYTAQYEDSLVDLVERFRAEFRRPNLPFVAAQLANFYVANNPGAAKINEAIARLPDRLPHTAFVTAEGLTPMPDGVHLDAASARELGKRYAAAMLALEGAK